MECDNRIAAFLVFDCSNVYPNEEPRKVLIDPDSKLSFQALLCRSCIRKLRYRDPNFVKVIK